MYIYIHHTEIIWRKSIGCCIEFHILYGKNNNFTDFFLVLIVCFFQLYLSYGYYITQTGLEYSFTWTIPQCVMTLRLIALSFDIYDGKRNEIIKKKFDDEDDLKKSQPQIINEDNAITKVPNLLELLSHAYFPGSIIMGPLISFKKYQEYILSTENMFSQR